jgi:hypothetical protein
MSRVNHAWLGLSDGQGQGHPYGERQANLVLEQANAHRTRRSQGRPAQPLAWRQVGISSVDDGTGEGSCAAMVGAGRGGGDAPPLVPGLAPGRRGRGDPEPHAGGARSALARTLQME